MRVLLTCGIGDFISIESHLTQAEREGVTAIHWATRARREIETLVPEAFPNVVEHVIERDTWGAPFTPEFCVSSRAELPNLPDDVVDWNVAAIADEIRRGAREYRGSSLIRRELIPPTYTLPNEYIVVHPYSENAPAAARDLTCAEWYCVQQRAKRMRLPIVIVNKGMARFPVQVRDVQVRDFTNMLSVREVVEITKGASMFVGCSSFPAIVAAQTLPAERLFVKAYPAVKKFFYWFYYAPQITNAFVTDDLRKIMQ